MNLIINVSLIFFLQCIVTLLRRSLWLWWLFLVWQTVVVQRETVIYLSTCQIKSYYDRYQSWDTYWDTTGSHKGSFTAQELGRSSEDLMTNNSLIIDFSISLLCLLWTLILSEVSCIFHPHVARSRSVQDTSHVSSLHFLVMLFGQRDWRQFSSLHRNHRIATSL